MDINIDELEDPTPDIYDLFQYYNMSYFNNLLGCCELMWSKRMTLCAGLCVYKGYKTKEFRPRSDLIQTLLHEMIHAYLFITANNKDRDGHGPEFVKEMNRINALENCNITIYHSFNDEVDYYRNHIWRCNGPCQKIEPYFGYVKRAMNRAPSEKDFWWSRHLSLCNGTFTKISEPEKKPIARKRDEKSFSIESKSVSKKDKKFKTNTSNSIINVDTNSPNSSSPTVLDWIFNTSKQETGESPREKKLDSTESIREKRLKWLNKNSAANANDLSDIKPFRNSIASSIKPFNKEPIVLDILDYDFEEEIIEL